MSPAYLDCEEALRLVHRFLGEEGESVEHLALREHLESCRPCHSVYLDSVGAAAALGRARRRLREEGEKNARRATQRRLALGGGVAAQPTPPPQPAHPVPAGPGDLRHRPVSERLRSRAPR